MQRVTGRAVAYAAVQVCFVYLILNKNLKIVLRHILPYVVSNRGLLTYVMDISIWFLSTRRSLVCLRLFPMTNGLWKLLTT